MKIPDKIFGISTSEAYKKYLEESKNPKVETSVAPAQRVTTSTAGVNLSDYLILPQHNLYISKEKTLHNKNWHQAHEELHEQNARMLTIKEFVDFLNLLKSGNVKDGLGNILSGSDVQVIYKEIVEKKDPWRSEWLDAYFKNVGGNMHMDYGHTTIKRKLQPQTSERLESCLMEDCYIYITSANKQGFPTKKSNSKEIYYWHPRADYVARFIADSGGADLGCGGDPRGSNPGLGVRQARVF